MVFIRYKTMMFFILKWSWLETLVWGRVTCCLVSLAMNSTLRAKALSEWSSPHGAFRWMGRRWRLRFGTQLDRNATEPSLQRKCFSFLIFQIPTDILLSLCMFCLIKSKSSFRPRTVSNCKLVMILGKSTPQVKSFLFFFIVWRTNPPDI